MLMLSSQGSDNGDLYPLWWQNVCDIIMRKKHIQINEHIIRGSKILDLVNFLIKGLGKSGGKVCATKNDIMKDKKLTSVWKG